MVKAEVGSHWLAWDIFFASERRLRPDAPKTTSEKITAQSRAECLEEMGASRDEADFYYAGFIGCYLWMMDRFYVQQLASMPYRDYLKTAHWQLKRQEAITSASNRCQLCNSAERLEVHHRTYERRGHELPEDLTVLCDKCHGKFHGKD
jgi:hypothetical protein